MASMVSSVVDSFSSSWLLIVCTVLLTGLLHAILSWRKKWMFARQLSEIVKDIPDVKSQSGSNTPANPIQTWSMTEHKCGPLSRWPLPGGSLINATHPEYAKCILAGVDKKTNYNWQLLRPYVGDSVLSSQGAKWFRNRRLLTPAFHFGVLKDYHHLFQLSVEPFLDKWSKISQSGSSVEVAEDIDTMTLKALLKCAFGDFPLSEQEQMDIQNAIKEVCIYYMKRFGNYLLSYDFIYSLTSDGRKFFNAIKKTRDLARKVISEKQRQLRDGKTSTKKYKDFLDIIIEARDEDGNSLTEDELIDEIQTFFFAGHDTTASAIPYVLYNLARHPEYQEKCRNEIENVFGEETQITSALAGKLQFVNMCIKESLRLHPPVWGINRKSAQSITFPDGRVLPADSEIGVGIYAILHNPNVWKDPYVYDPYRFHPDNVTENHPYAFVPFSAGPRNCIGKEFAMSEIRVTVVATLRRFRLSLDEKKPLKECLKILLKSKDGVWLNLEEL